MKMITREQIFAEILEIFMMANTSKDVDVKKIKEEDDLTLDLGLTSVGALYVAIAIEEKFDIDFGNVTFNDLKKVKDVIDLIESKLK